MNGWTRSKVDRLGDKLRTGNFSPDEIFELNEYRESFRPAYDFVVSRVSSALHVPITGRPAKSISALVDKLQRQNSRLSQIQDIAGCRVVVEDIFIQDRSLRALEVYLNNPIVFDRRKKPSHGYRAMHLVADFEGHKVEVQLRTELQHLWAEISEKMADTIGSSIKYGNGDAEALKLLRNLSLAVGRVEVEEAARRDFLLQFNNQSQNLDKKKKKLIRTVEKSFFEQRGRLLQLLQDVHGHYSEVVTK